jgi:hypothetical protein
LTFIACKIRQEVNMDIVYAGKNSGVIVAIHETGGDASLAIRVLRGTFRGRVTKSKDTIKFTCLDDVSLAALIDALENALDSRALHTERWTYDTEAEETRGRR